jgi:N utilization substance protein A
MNTYWLITPLQTVYINESHMKLFDVIEELVEERGLDRTVLGTIICEGMLAAYQKRYPDLTLRVEYDKKSDEIMVEAQKTVVSTVTDEDKEISVKKARFIDKDLEADQTVWVPFEGKIGRIEILRAKQIIAGKIRKVEATAVYNEFKSKEGTIVHGVIHKSERGGVVVKLGDNMAFLPKSLSIPGDKSVVGFPIRALLKEVLLEPRNENQLILDRASELFLQRLFELEIPEIFEKLVEIKKIVRIPGYKSKMAVVSNDSNIDPVGTCVGVGGSRIKPILKELGTEKIDVIVWSDNLETLVKDALKPAEINRVELAENNIAHVWLEEDQRSLAIGKMGQNIALASRLTGVNIQLIQNAVSQQEKESKLEALDTFEIEEQEREE